MMPAMEIPKARANCLEELVNHIVRRMVRGDGWGSARKHGMMYLLAYSMNNRVIDLKHNIRQQGGYWLFPPDSNSNSGLGALWNRRKRC